MKAASVFSLLPLLAIISFSEAVPAGAVPQPFLVNGHFNGDIHFVQASPQTEIPGSTSTSSPDEVEIKSQEKPGPQEQEDVSKPQNVSSTETRYGNDKVESKDEDVNTQDKDDTPTETKSHDETVSATIIKELPSASQVPPPHGQSQETGVSPKLQPQYVQMSSQGPSPYHRTAPPYYQPTPRYYQPAPRYYQPAPQYYQVPFQGPQFPSPQYYQSAPQAQYTQYVQQGNWGGLSAKQQKKLEKAAKKAQKKADKASKKAHKSKVESLNRASLIQSGGYDRPPGPGGYPFTQYSTGYPVSQSITGYYPNQTPVQYTANQDSTSGYPIDQGSAGISMDSPVVEVGTSIVFPNYPSIAPSNDAPAPRTDNLTPVNLIRSIDGNCLYVKDPKKSGKPYTLSGRPCDSTNLNDVYRYAIGIKYAVDGASYLTARVPGVAEELCAVKHHKKIELRPCGGNPTTIQFSVRNKKHRAFKVRGAESKDHFCLRITKSKAKFTTCPTNRIQEHAYQGSMTFNRFETLVNYGTI